MKFFMKFFMSLFTVLLVYSCNESPAAPQLHLDSIYFTAHVGVSRPIDTVRIFPNTGYLVTGVMSAESALPYTYGNGMTLTYTFDYDRGELLILLDCSKYDGRTFCACDTSLQSIGVGLRASVVW